MNTVGVKWNVILPRSILPHSAISPQHTMRLFAPEITFEKTYYVNYNIARCSIKWCENANKRHTIIYIHMQWFYYLICQSNWCQKRVNWFIKRVKFRFCEILKTWSIASLISVYDVELTDDRNQVYVNIDPRQACFFQNTQCSILPPCSILPRLTIQSFSL